MQISSISVFRDAKNSLIKRPENGYGSCCDDICEELKGKSLEDIYEMNFLVREIGSLRIIKIRVQNSLQNLSKADGYRVIVLCNIKTNELVLLNIYPKRGKYGKADLTPNEYKQLLQIFKEEKQNNKLKVHDTAKKLEEVAE